MLATVDVSSSLSNMYESEMLFACSSQEMAGSIVPVEPVGHHNARGGILRSQSTVTREILDQPGF